MVIDAVRTRRYQRKLLPDGSPNPNWRPDRYRPRGKLLPDGSPNPNWRPRGKLLPDGSPNPNWRPDRHRPRGKLLPDGSPNPNWRPDRYRPRGKLLDLTSSQRAAIVSTAARSDLTALTDDWRWRPGRYSDRVGIRRHIPAAVVRAVALLFAHSDGLCYLCDRLIEDGERLAIDHLVPEGEGGTHVPDNLQIVHWTCHQHRRDSPWEQRRAEDRRRRQAGSGPLGPDPARPPSDGEIRWRAAWQTEGQRRAQRWQWLAEHPAEAADLKRQRIAAHAERERAASHGGGARLPAPPLWDHMGNDGGR